MIKVFLPLSGISSFIGGRLLTFMERIPSVLVFVALKGRYQYKLQYGLRSLDNR